MDRTIALCDVCNARCGDKFFDIQPAFDNGTLCRSKEDKYSVCHKCAEKNTLAELEEKNQDLIAKRARINILANK